MSHFEEFGKLVSGKLGPAELRRMQMADAVFQDACRQLGEELRPLSREGDYEPYVASAVVKLSDEERKWAAVQSAYWEVEDAVDRLRVAEASLTKPPSEYWLRRADILSSTYVAYHVESYMEEMYILEDRVRRLLRKIKAVSPDEAAVDTLGQIVMPNLKLLKGLRRVHVHVRRLQRVQTRAVRGLELAARSDRDVRPLQARISGWHRLTWVTEVAQWNRLLEATLEHLFGELTRILAAD